MNRRWHGEDGRFEAIGQTHFVQSSKLRFLLRIRLRERDQLFAKNFDFPQAAPAARIATQKRDTHELRIQCGYQMTMRLQIGGRRAIDERLPNAAVK